MKRLSITFLLIFYVILNLSASESDSDWNISNESNEFRIINTLESRSESEEQNALSEDNKLRLRSMEERIKRSKPHKYMRTLLREVESDHSSHPHLQQGSGGTVSLKIHGQTYENPRDRLFYAWMPTETKDISTDRTTVVFQQTLPRDHFGNFTASHIVLTMLDNVELDLDKTTQISMYIHWENEMFEQELSQTQIVLPEKKFYSFDIKEFIESRLQHNLTHPHFITISFQVMVRHARSRMADFKKLFDIQVDTPFIIFFYHDFLPREITSTDMPLSRKFRSVSERPTTQCQRRNFEVLPEEVNWVGVVSPEKLDLGYCSGTCPTPLQDHYYNITLHSFLLDRYRLRAMFDVPSDFPHSTCIPVTYKSITVYEQIGPDEFEASIVHNISVATCGCRY
ncbi:unnamed protein product [Orchesella dallaii]|uniref:TGF-beta family profile domain-containing protein n=1 Tax=Orchesella dallaii TaxID=48710 RepID=A0ABP1QMZ8_9HEXA